MAKAGACTVRTATLAIGLLVPWPGTTNDADARLLWHTSHESGDLSDWSRGQTGAVYNTGPAQVSATDEAAHSGRFAAKMEVWGIDEGPRGARIFRWAERLREGYFSCWMMMPVVPDVDGWLNVFQFKKKDASVEPHVTDPTWYNEVRNRSTGTTLTLTHWNQTWNLPASAWSAPPIRPGGWFHVEWYYRDGVDDGELAVWVDGRQVWRHQGIDTRGVDPLIQWALSLYGESVRPGHLVMYVDDAAISTHRLGPAYFSPSGEPGLAGAWRFDVAGRPYDASGRGQTVAFLGGGSTIGGAGEFDGSDDRVVAYDPDLNVTGEEITLAAWVYLDELPAHSAGILTNGGWADGYRLQVARTGAIAFQMTESVHGSLVSQKAIGPGEWRHVASTYDGATMRVYLDGARDPAEKPRTGPIDPSTGEVWIGFGDRQVGVPWSYPLKGRIGDIRIYKRALGDDEIRTLATQPPPAGERGLVAHYTFDSPTGTEDSGPNGLHLTGHGGVGLAEGVSGNAVWLDGVDDRAAASGPALNVPCRALTLAAWVNLAELPGASAGILNNGGWFDGYRLQITRTGAVAFQLTESVHGSLVSQSLLQPGTWHHVAATYDGATMRIYVDGVRDPAQKALTGPIDPGTGELWIGLGDRQVGKPWSYPFRGHIDEVRIYERTLSDEEIRTLAGGGGGPSGPPPPPPSEPGLVARYTFDSTTGAEDSGPHGLHLSGFGGVSLDEGILGNAARFDGVDDRATASGPALNVTVEAISLAAWVNLDALPAFSAGVLNNGGWAAGYRLQITRTGAIAFQLTESVHGTLVSQSLVGPGAWHHVAATYDGATMRAYVDGVRDPVESARTGPVDPSTGEVWIGFGDRAVGMPWSYPLGGRIDEVLIYNRALADEEVGALATRPPARAASKPAVEDANSDAPAFGLAPIQPNPFNPATTIRYSLGETAHARLTIYSVLGQEVVRLVDETQAPGTYTVPWDGKDGAGRLAASGVYICRLQGGTHTAAERMVLAR